ncbi:MAG: glycoside hydrolase family 25 protein [Eubacteriales bacterium]
MIEERNELEELSNSPEVKKKNKIVSQIVIFGIQLITIIIISTVCVYFALQYYMVKGQLEEQLVQETIYLEPIEESIELLEEDLIDRRVELLDEMRSYLLDGNSTVSLMRNLFTDEIVFVDSEGYNFIPIDNTLMKREQDVDNFVLDEKGRLEYVENGVVLSQKGIDVARFQGDINWEKVAGDNISFAMIRVGARGYGSGAIILDEKFHNNIQGALAAGVEVGVYFYTQAITTEEAIEEAQLVIQELAAYKDRVTWPVVLDVEDPESNTARTHEITRSQRTDYTITFLEMVEAEGYEPMIYGNMYSLLKMLDIYRIEEYPKWYANYNMDNVYYPYKMDIWQYTDSGRVDGISTAVDLNIAFR